MKIIHPLNYPEPINIMVLADWGVIKTSGLTPILKFARLLMVQKDIHLLIVNGDIAYELDSDNGARYLGFL
jgi:hypothetical protein